MIDFGYRDGTAGISSRLDRRSPADSAGESRRGNCVPRLQTLMVPSESLALRGPGGRLRDTSARQAILQNASASFRRSARLSTPRRSTRSCNCDGARRRYRRWPSKSPQHREAAHTLVRPRESRIFQWIVCRNFNGYCNSLDTLVVTIIAPLGLPI